MSHPSPGALNPNSFGHGSTSRTPSEHPIPLKSRLKWGWSTYPKCHPMGFDNSHALPGFLRPRGDRSCGCRVPHRHPGLRFQASGFSRRPTAGFRWLRDSRVGVGKKRRGRLPGRTQKNSTRRRKDRASARGLWILSMGHPEYRDPPDSLPRSASPPRCPGRWDTPPWHPKLTRVNRQQILVRFLGKPKKCMGALMPRFQCP